MNNTVTGSEKYTNTLQMCLRKWKQDRTEWPRRGNYVKYESDAYRLLALENLCQNGADLHYLEKQRGFSLIPHVFWSEELIQFFLDRGIDINSRDEEGNTALHLALRYDGIIEKPGVIYDAIGPEDDPLHVIKFLLDHSADPNVANLRGENALFALAKGGFQNFTENRYAREITSLFQDRGADASKNLNIDGESVFHVQTYNYSDRKPIITLDTMIEGADIDLRTSEWLYSETALMYAAGGSWYYYCRELVKKGANVNCTDLQGYTPLHHAVLNSNKTCANLLVKWGADPNLKSACGRDAYDLGIYHNWSDQFTCGAAPEKLVELNIKAGAMRIMMNLESGVLDLNFDLWVKAMRTCRKFNVQPSGDFSAIYQFAKQNPNAHEVLYCIAMNTVARSSLTELSKFWDLLMFPYNMTVNFGQTYFFYKLDFLSEDLKRVGDFASIEQPDLYSLSNVVEFLYKWLEELTKLELLELKMEALTPERISQIHSIANLVIACFKKLIDATNSRKVSDTCMNIYFRLCYVLTSLKIRFNDVISKEDLNYNERLLQTLIDLDLRDRDLNSLMHTILGKRCYSINIKSEYDLVGALVELTDYVQTSRNLYGSEPVQLINWKKWGVSKFGQKEIMGLIVKLADRRVHVDARNECGPLTIRDIFKKERPYLAFHYDSLQCACARVLAKSLVPFVNRVPKPIVDFIRAHLE